MERNSPCSTLLLQRSSLINGSKLTNFAFKLKNALPPDLVSHINELEGSNKIQHRIASILEHTKLEFSKIKGDTYRNNIRLIDADLERILSVCLLKYYTGSVRKISDMSTALELENPCGYERLDQQPFYSYKLKKFLVEHALGMVAKDVWDGRYHASGGYIVVKADGNLVSYHLMKKNLFEDYLFSNTKFDTMSTNPRKGDFGYIYHESGEQYIDLNLMVKFVK